MPSRSCNPLRGGNVKADRPQKWLNQVVADPTSSSIHLSTYTLRSCVGLAHSREMMSRSGWSLTAETRTSTVRRQIGAVLFVAFVAAFASAATSGQPSPPLPNRADSLKFAVIGDNGTGDVPQFEVAQQMDTAHATFPFELVIMLGDNMYGSQQAADFITKFQEPYARLLAAGVTFHASLGNHDRPENVSYKPFNMNGARYYVRARTSVSSF